MLKLIWDFLSVPVQIFLLILLLLPVSGFVFSLLGIINWVKKVEPAEGKPARARAKKQLAGGAVLIVCFGVLFVTSGLLIIKYDPVLSCFFNTGRHDAFSDIETEKIKSMDPKWVQELVDFSANTISATSGQSIDGVVIARVPSTSSKAASQVWHVKDNKLVPDTVQTFQKVTASGKPSPGNPHFVILFTIIYASKNRVCLNVETLYNMGLTGGRGGNGEIWYLRHERSGWTVKTKFNYYLAD